MESNVPRIFLILTALVCGTLIMVIEVLGSRVIGPFFGVSLFVWTSLIAVTMIALAAGYMIGGIISDRARSADVLYILIGIAGLMTLVIPYIKVVILKSCLALGLRGGAFIGSLILFAPSLTLLGCVSPFVIKLAAREFSNVGRTVGSFYALSTIGSVLGTVLTGFVFIAYLGVNNIFFLVGLLLVALSLSFFVLFRKKPAIGGLIIPILFLPFIAPTTVDSKIMEDGVRVTIVDKTDSRYGSIKVFDRNDGRFVVRQMAIDGLPQGGVDVNNGLPILGYAYLMEYVPVAYNPQGRRCLVIGLGSGVIPRWFMSRGVETDVVDIDPAVVEMAVKNFGYPAGERVVIEDARYFLEKTDKKYDYIILDVFNGDVTPAHVLSKEAFSLIKERLSADGVFALNIIGSLGEDSLMTVSVLKTLETVFGKVSVKPLFHPGRGESFGNIAVFAHSPVLQTPREITIHPQQIHPLVRFEVLAALKSSYTPPDLGSALVLTDEYNPMDIYDLESKEKLRRLILERIDWDILLS